MITKKQEPSWVYEVAVDWGIGRDRLGVNTLLGTLPCHRDKACCRCGHTGQPGELNIEGQIHHKTPVSCIDQKACRRRQRKSRRKG